LRQADAISYQQVMKIKELAKEENKNVAFLCRRRQKMDSVILRVSPTKRADKIESSVKSINNVMIQIDRGHFLRGANIEISREYKSRCIAWLCKFINYQ